MLPLLLASTEGIGRAADTITHQITLPPGQSWCDDGMIVGLFNQINTFRTQNGVPALKMDALGMKDAEIRATQFIANMAANRRDRRDSTLISDMTRRPRPWAIH